MRPFPVSQSSHISTKSKRCLDPSESESDRTPYPSDTDSRSQSSAYSHSHHAYTHGVSAPKSKSRRPNDALGSYSPRKPVLKLQLPSHTLPDDDECASFSSHRQPSRHAHRASLVSPISPTAVKKLGEVQPRPARDDSVYSRPSNNAARKPVSPVRSGEAQKWREWSGSVEDQLTDVSAALRRAEADRQKAREKLETGRAERYRMERELEETRRENRRLAARLEEALKSPLSARSDDAWGCSMYDLEVDGR